MTEHSRTDTGPDGFARAHATVRRLLSDCAWHAEQSHQTLARYLTEEAAEFLDALARAETDGTSEVAAELGDVLYQVLLHASIAERDSEGYSLDSVAHTLADKLIARHPHVFGERGAMTAAELDANWEHLKAGAAGQKRGDRSVFEGIPEAMPTLAKATKVVDRARRAKQLDALPGAVEENSEAGTVTEDSIARELFAAVRKANANGIDPDLALRKLLAAHISNVDEQDVE